MTISSFKLKLQADLLDKLGQHGMTMPTRIVRACAKLNSLPLIGDVVVGVIYLAEIYMDGVRVGAILQ